MVGCHVRPGADLMHFQPMLLLIKPCINTRAIIDFVAHLVKDLLT